MIEESIRPLMNAGVSPSFPRKRESRGAERGLDSRVRGNDEHTAPSQSAFIRGPFRLLQ